jgi:hypothetical protein
MDKSGFEILAKEPRGEPLAKKSYLMELPGGKMMRSYAFYNN